ncbi:ABC transporter permease [Cellulophaga baltica]|uniref:ABC transporter permease n=1 Tax=Cellulophaga baltica TaxID=76594 RepID=UPI0015F6494B|nr:FtsX-like permease family protein [Cellulophaga baltica]MBA6314347.1 ABC transporter permease [Cellulophaga baltica]
MNLEYFIAKRLSSGKGHKNSISGPIIKIAIAAITISIVMMLIAIATGGGLKKKIREKIAAFNGHIQISTFDNNRSDVSVSPIYLEQDFYPEFKNVSGIQHVQAVASKGGIVRTEETVEGILAKGVGQDYNWSVFEEFIVAGRVPNFLEDRSDEVLISRLLSNKLKLKLGDTFMSIFLRDNDPSKMPNQQKSTIVGIYDSGFEEFDATYVFMDIRHIQRMNKWEDNQIGNFEIFIDDFDAIDEKSLEISGKTFSLLQTTTIKDKFSFIFQWLDLFDFNTALIIGIMILVGGINMITALLVLILERTTMIGILKALGANDWSVRKIFLYNAAYLISIGLFLGNFIGLGIIWAQDKYRMFKFPNPKEYYIEYIPVHISVTAIVALNIGVMILCLLMLIIPSYIITKITPVKAIKFD